MAARLFACAILVLLAAPALAQDAVWANTGLEKRGITGEAFQELGKVDIAHCEAVAARSARRAVPVAHPPPGFMEGWRQSSLDRERLAREREFMVACMAEKGWALQRK
ncbi:MAG: hypothetical protein ACT4P4_14900 [Betaproteobacteria bacterium]